MNRSFSILLLLLVILVAGCQSSSQIDAKELEKYKVQQTEDEVKQGDFIFRLVSEKGEYRQDEEVKLYGEIEYIGEKEEVSIVHSASAILFSLEEKVRGYHIESSVQEIGVTTKLKKGEPYRENYVKKAEVIFEEDPSYQKFVDYFLEGRGFPTGYYKVNGYTDFFVKSEDEGEHINIEANVDFKVIE